MAKQLHFWAEPGNFVSLPPAPFQVLKQLWGKVWVLEKAHGEEASRSPGSPHFAGARIFPKLEVATVMDCQGLMPIRIREPLTGYLDRILWRVSVKK